MAIFNFGRFGKTSRRPKSSASRPARRTRGTFETLESRQLLSITLPALSNVTLNAGTTMYIPLYGADAGHTVNYAVTASDASKVTAVMMPETNKTLRLTVDIGGTAQTMDFQLFDNLAPETTAKIEEWVNAHYYDGLEIYRNYWLDSTTAALIQGGNDDPTNGPIKTGKDSMAEEFNPNLQYTTAGMLGMARTTTPGSSSSEFFITESGSDAMRSFLDWEYTIFGVQTSGFSTVSTIAAMPNESSSSSYLATPITITSATIISDNQGGVLQISAPTGATGSITITVTAYDDTGSSTPQNFTVALQADATTNPANPFAAKRPTSPTSVTYVPVGSVSTTKTDTNHGLKFQVSGVTKGCLVEILCDGNVIGQATATTASVTVTTNSTINLTDGDHTFTAIQIAKSQTVSISENGTSVDKTADVPSFSSPAVTVTIDTHAPTLTFPEGLTAVVAVAYKCQVAVVEKDSMAITYELTHSPNGMTIDSTTGIILWTPTSAQVGPTEVTVQATNAAGNKSQKTYKINVLASNAAPVLEPKSPTLSLTNGVIPITSFINSAGGTIVTDSDAGTVLGITLVNTTGAGTWQYSIDGTTFVNVGTVSEGSALLLPSNAVLKYIRSGSAAESGTIKYHAWDTTGGAATARVDLSGTGATGGSTAYSTATDTATLSLLAAPTVDVTLAAGQAATTKNSTINFTVTFSRDVTGFTADDLSLTSSTAPGTLAGTVTPVSGSTYNVVVTGMTGSGTVVLKIPASVVVDSAGTENVASPSNATTNIVQYDVTAPTVTVARASDQAQTTNKSTVKFTVTFNEKVYDFPAADFSFTGSTASGNLAGTVTAGANGDKTYTVTVTGMTGDGTIVLSIPAGAAKDAAGNASIASTGASNTVTYDITGPTVTINKASTQNDPTGSTTVYFTVVFSEGVADFTKDDVVLSGTAGPTIASVTGSGTTYTVAVTGMTSTGTVVASIPANAATDTLGNKSPASTSADNSVSFILVHAPTFRITAPKSIKTTVGNTVVIAWSITNVVAGTSVSLCYDKDKVWNGNEKWLTTTETAKNGYSVYSWNTTGMAPGTYYIAGYLMSGKAIRSHLTQTIIIQPIPAPTFRVTSPTSGTFVSGKTVTVYWSAANAPAGSTVNLCLDRDTKFNGNEKWITTSVDNASAAAVNGYHKYTWTISDIAAGKYYVGGFLLANGKQVLSHLAKPITVIAPTPTFRVTAPSSGAYTAGEDIKTYWLAKDAPTNATVSLCYDTDKVFNGNEHWVKLNLNNSDMDLVGGYRSVSWNSFGLAPGKYYLGGFLTANGKNYYSHLTMPITVTAAAALTVDDSAPRLANAPIVNDKQLQTIVAEAERRLAITKGTQVLSAMSGVSVQIVDLPGNTLGEVVGDTVYIDRDAAGYGWFVDSTPADDSEFSSFLGDYALAARKGTDAMSRVDLLTTVMHEMGHVLGLGHSNSLDLMAPTLLPGERRFLNDPAMSALAWQENATSSHNDKNDADAVDQLFASCSSSDRDWALQ